MFVGFEAAALFLRRETSVATVPDFGALSELNGDEVGNAVLAAAAREEGSEPGDCDSPPASSSFGASSGSGSRSFFKNSPFETQLSRTF
jgi:hypothetical protein